MSRFIRSLCLACFCILGIAVAILIFEAAALDRVLDISGCKVGGDLFAYFVCARVGLVSYSTELVLNLPLLFMYAPFFTLFPAPGRTFMLLVYVLDLVLILGLTYPLLVLLGWKHAKHSG